MGFRKQQADALQVDDVDGSHVARARRAFVDGALFFECSLPRASVQGLHAAVGARSLIDGDDEGDAVLSAVASVGWRLVHAGWVYAPTMGVDTIGKRSLQQGQIVGVYLFERSS